MMQNSNLNMSLSISHKLVDFKNNYDNNLHLCFELERYQQNESINHVVLSSRLELFRMCHAVE